MLVVDATKGLNIRYSTTDFTSLAQYVFFRANAEMITESEISDKKICEAHLRFLLTEWPNVEKEQKKERRFQRVNEMVCLLPHEGPAPRENQKASKSNVLWWLRNKHTLIHIGTSVCSSHRNMMRGTEAGDQPSVMRKIQPERLLDNDEWTGPEEDPGGDYGDFNEDCNDINGDNDKNMENIRHQFAEISKLISSTSFHSEIDWNLLAKDTQRRKIDLVCQLFDLLCIAMSASGHSDIKSAALQKMTRREDEAGCAEQILNSVGERFGNATNRRARIEALATIVDIPYFSRYSVLLTIPGVTRYYIHQARLFARGGIDLDTKYTRMKFNKPAVKYYLSFLSRSNALVSLAWISNQATKSDGTKVDLASTIRTQSYSSIIRLYQKQIKVENKPKEETISTGSAYAILKKLVPKLSTRKTCVDEYACVANEAWRQLNEIVKLAGARYIITDAEQVDIIRRLRLAKGFVECELRNHIEISSNVIQHCATFALSDSTNRAYRRKCTHNHDEECKDCMQTYHTLALIRSCLSDTSGLSDSDKYEVDRWLDLVEKCRNDLRSYIAHVIRGVVSDCAKVDVLDNLMEGECLLTLDWAQKFLPSSAEESQGGFYGKTGISLHVAHAATVRNDQKLHHSFLHTIDCCVQDSYSVSPILKHTLALLKDHGIHKVTMRSDNAGCFKSNALIGDIACYENDLPSLSAIIYSESQLGKGPCDRTTSHAKRKVNERTDGLEDTRNAEEIFKALTEKDPIRGTSAYHVTINCSPEDKPDNVKKIDSISSIFDVRFEEGKVITRKHTGIGEGTTTITGLQPITSTLTIHGQGGFIDNDNFWSAYGENNSESEPQSDPVNNNTDDQLLTHKNVYFCSTPGCIKVFTTLANLEKHEFLGVHRIREKKETMLDFAIDAFSEHVETEEAARLTVTGDSFRNVVIGGKEQELKEGYALKKLQNNPITQKARSVAEEFFLKHRNMNPPKRACPRTFSQSMKQMKESNGNYMFLVSQLLSEKQTQGLFSRWEKKRTTGVTVAKRNLKKSTRTVTSKGSRKRRLSDDEESATSKKAHTLNDNEGQEVEDEEGKEEEIEEEDECEFLMAALMEDRDELFL